MSNIFYLQDSRSYVGNDVLWWAAHGGYTTDLSKARLFTLDEAQQQNNVRETDIPWPKAYIDAKTRQAVDMQYINRSQALCGTGIVLQKPRRQNVQSNRCGHCGAFISERQRYEDCPKCGGENRP